MSETTETVTTTPKRPGRPSPFAGRTVKIGAAAAKSKGLFKIVDSAKIVEGSQLSTLALDVLSAVDGAKKKQILVDELVGRKVMVAGRAGVCREKTVGSTEIGKLLEKGVLEFA